MQSQFTLASSSTTVDGSALLLQSRSGTVLCHAFLAGPAAAQRARRDWYIPHLGSALAV